MKKIIFNLFLLLSAQLYSLALTANTNTQQAKDTQEVYQLTYIEREPGTDDYEVTMLVSDRYIRIDEVGEGSGFIIYDDEKKVIYSVGHQDRSILVIRQHKFSEKNSPAKANVEYLQLADAPTVSGRDIYNYRVFVNTGAGVVDEEETCTEIQLVEGLLPEVRTILQNYQKVVSGQQVKMVDNKITDMQCSCFYVDQIYNSGAYYEKGLPIQEWHSNEHSKMLTTYNKLSVDSDKFKIPENYRQFSIGKDPEIAIQ
jgi:hypothetical protein